MNIVFKKCGLFTFKVPNRLMICNFRVGASVKHSRDVILHRTYATFASITSSSFRIFNQLRVLNLLVSSYKSRGIHIIHFTINLWTHRFLALIHSNLRNEWVFTFSDIKLSIFTLDFREWLVFLSTSIRTDATRNAISIPFTNHHIRIDFLQ